MQGSWGDNMGKVIKGPIKVLQVIHNAGPTGPGRMVYGIARHIDKEQFLIDVLCPGDGYLAQDLIKIGVKVVPLEAGRIWSVAGIFHTWRRLRREGYHVLHVHSGQLNAFSKVIGCLLGIPSIIFVEHFSAEDHIWIKNKITLSIHTMFHALSNAMADRIVAVSDAARSSFIKRQGIAPAKVVTIYNGVDSIELKTHRTDKGKIKERWGISENALIVGIIARLSPEKSHKALISAAEEVLTVIPDTRFLIVGEGQERKNIEDQIDRAGLKKSFILTGAVRGVYELMDIMDVVVQPSMERGESFGLAVVEAMAKSKAVIVSDIKCFKAIISDDKNGLIFPAGDHVRLAEKILLLLSDGGLRERLGRSAQMTVRENFDIRTTVQKTQEVYRQTLAAKDYCPGDGHFKKITAAFLDSIRKEMPLTPEKRLACLNALEKYLSFIKDRRLTQVEVDGYLEEEDNFLIESFLQFLKRTRPVMDETRRFNNTLFEKTITHKAVTSRDYDERIKMQMVQFQIDKYYQPKDGAGKKRIDVLLSVIQPKAGEAILDVGCGVGTFAYHCAVMGARTAGVDYSRESINVARELSGRFGAGGKTEFICCDAAKQLPYSDKCFDKVVAADFIEHIDDLQKRDALSEMVRVLKPGGIVIIFTPNELRERMGAIKNKLVSLFFSGAPRTRLHYGMTNRFKFEKTLRDMNLAFSRRFLDITRPYLAKIPVLNEILSLDILWVIKK